MKRKSTRLRELLQREEILFRPGVAIALEAKMAEAVGFECVGISGANFASQVLGLPDAGLITLTEVIENARRVCGAVDIPVMVDLDTGFGNAINVRRAVREAILAGAAGFFIEDQVAPKRCGFVSGKELLPLGESIGKFRAAIDARNEIDPDVIIMARTDARTAVGGSLEEAISRSKAYKEVGVDVSYVEALKSREEIAAVRAAVPGLLAFSTQAMRPMPDLRELQALGCCMTLGTIFSHVGNVAKWDMLVAMKKEGLAPFVTWAENHRDHPAAFPRIMERVGFSKIREWEEAYLETAEVEARYAGSVGIFDPGRDA